MTDNGKNYQHDNPTGNRFSDDINTCLRYIYRYLYYVGVCLIRHGRRWRNNSKNRRYTFRQSVKTKLHHRRNRVKIFFKRQFCFVLAPFRNTVRNWKNLKRDLNQATDLPGFRSVDIVMRSVRATVATLIRYFFYILNWIVPFVGVWILLGTVTDFKNLNFALEVEYSGEKVGYIQDEAAFDTAEKAMKQRVIVGEFIEAADVIPKFTITVVDRNQLTDPDDLVDRLISTSGNSLEKAVGLYVDYKFIGAVKDQNALLLALDALKDPYRDGDINTRITFTKSVKISEGLYPTTSVKEMSEIETLFNTEVAGERNYIVVAGDAPTLIADKTDTPYKQIKALNPEIEQRLMPGDVILIKQSVPFMPIRTYKSVTYSEDIPYKITKKSDTSKKVGYQNITQNGELGLKVIKAEVVYLDGLEETRIEVESTVVREPIEQIMVVGGSQPLTYIPTTSGGVAPTGNFNWPVGGNGGKVTYGLYGYPGHTGVDIGAKQGTPVYAVASGTVVIAKQSGAYGKHVVIDHGGGLQTWYAHCSAVNVGVGAQVKQGQQIGNVGQTGNAFGSHLHIEFRQNNQYLNALNYIR